MLPYKSLFTESRFTRMAQTNEQEEQIEQLEKWLSKLGKKIVGGTTIGKSPQTVILDLTYQGGEIRVRAYDDGNYPFCTVNDKEVNDFEDLKDALEIGDSEIIDDDTDEEE